MKTKILTLLFFFICSISLAQDITVSSPSITKDSTNLKIAFALKVKKISSNAKLVITPILEGDSTKQFLTPITLIGRNMRISMQRKGVALPPNAVRKAKNIKDYSVAIPLKEWMTKTNLKLNTELTACNNTTRETISILRETKTDLSRPNLKRQSDPEEILKQHRVAKFKEFEKKVIVYPFVHPIEQYSELTKNPTSAKSNGSKLYYKLNESKIDTSYNTNQAALTAIKEAVQIIGSNESVNHCKIVVYGTASPEGSDAYNKKLAQARADWMVNYISNFVDSSYIETVNLGENWDDLRDLIEQSGMPYRQEVLDIIDNYTVAEDRKEKLKNLHVGIPYRYINEQFFPQLRCAHYIQIFYDKK